MEQDEQVIEECISNVKELLRCYEKEIEHTDFFVSKETTEAYRRYLFSSREQLEKLLDRLYGR